MASLTSDTVVVTGGLHTRTRVTRYGTAGVLESLPSLREGRYTHGCGAYRQAGDQVRQWYLYLHCIQAQVIIVAGGYGEHRLSSTEILRSSSSSWVLTSPLPRQLSGLRGATVDQVFLITGMGG